MKLLLLVCGRSIKAERGLPSFATLAGKRAFRLRRFRPLAWCLLVTFGLQETALAFPSAALPSTQASLQPSNAIPPFAPEVMAGLGAAPPAPKHVHFAPDPVNLSNGNLVLPMLDLSLPAYRFPLKIERVYNSRSVEDGPFGFGWTFNYEVKIRGDASGLLVQEGDGSTRHHRSSNNGFESQVGAYNRIEKASNGNYVRVQAGGVREQFDSNGRLARMEDGDGYWLQFTYQNNRLIGVKDRAGRALTFEYNSQGKVSGIIDPLKRTLRYRYDDRDNLIASMDLSGYETHYRYDGLHNLIGVRYPDGAETAMTYDTQRDLILTESGPGGRNTSYQYLMSTSTTDQYSVVVTDGLGQRTTYSFRKTPDGLTLTTTDPLGGETMKSYDQRENLLLTRDPLMRTTRYRYDRYNRVTQVEKPAGVVWKFDYHDLCGCGEPTVITDPLGLVTRQTFDQNHNLTEIRDAANRVTRFAWDPKQRTRTITRPGGEKTTLAYNASGLLARAVNPQGNTTRLTYDQGGRLLSLTDAKGATYGLEYDRSDRLTAMATPLGGRMTFDYDPRGRLVSVEDLDGARIRHVYGHFERPTKVIDAMGRETLFEYDVGGRLTARIDALGRRTRFQYDQGGRIVEVEAPAGERMRITYDAVGNMTAMTDASGTTFRFQYDALNRLVAAIDGLGSRTVFRYDAADRLTKEIDADGRETALEYDAAGRLIKALNLLGNSAQYSYDVSGNLTSRTDAKGAVTRYAYDRAGRLIAETDPIGRRTEYVRDDNGLPTRIIYPDAKAISLKYDGMRSLTEIQGASGEYERRAYTPAGRLRQVQTPVGTSIFERDPLGRLVRVEDTASKKRIEYRYDEVGNRLSMTVRGSRDRVYEFTYRYDPSNRLVSLVNPFGEETRFRYDSVGRRVREDLANGVSVEYAYDPSGRLIRKSAIGKTSTPILRLEYAYDGVGLIREARDEAGSNRYTYDAFRQLLAVARNGGGGEQFTYDPAGNVRSRSTASGSVQLSYDQADQLQSSNGTKASYDRRGNLTLKSGPQGETRLAYDGFNRLTGAALPNGDQVTYTYGSSGQLQTRKDARGSRHFLYDGVQRLMELGEDLEPRTIYTPGPHADEVISHRHGDRSIFYHTDPFRTVRGLSDRFGQLVASYDYNSFGRLLTTSPAPVTDILFTGRPYDAATGIVDYRLRQYDPALGRFLQRDPLNLMFPLQHSYAYVGNNPVNRIDPYGLWFNSLYETVGTVALGLGAAALVGAGLVVAGVIAVPAAVAAAGVSIAAAAGTTAGTVILGGAGAGALINAAVTLGQRGVGPQGTTLVEVLGAAVVGGVIGGTGAGIAAGAGTVTTVAALTGTEATVFTGAVGGLLGGGAGALLNEVNNQTHGEPFRPYAVVLGAAGGTVLGGVGASLGTAEGTALSACSAAIGSLLGEVGPQ